MLCKLFRSLIIFGYMISIMDVEKIQAMSEIQQLVNEVAQNPTDTTRLQPLVEALIDEENGSSRTEDAIKALKSIQVAEQYKESFDHVDCMIWEIYENWGGGYKRINFINYYIDGALNGRFGPYNLYSTKSF